MIDNDVFNLINKSIKKVSNLNEENTKQHIVIPVLNLLEYESECFIFENRDGHKNKIVDISWIKDNDILYIEVKRADYDIKNSDVKQLTDYIIAKNINWGILTNGKRYILINKNIECIGYGEDISLDRIVLDVDGSNKNKKTYLKYFSKRYIFDNKHTNYFRDIAQFKSYFLAEKKEGSWIQYKSTLNNFVEYLIEKYENYRPLNSISFVDFKDYWKHKLVSNDEIKSIRTYKAQYAHVSSLFYTLHEKEKITGKNNFAYITTKEVEESYYFLFNRESIIENKFVLNELNIKEAINVLNSKRDDNRNIIILLLAVYCGITRSDIESLKWEDLDLKKGKIKFKNRTIPLPKTIKDRLDILSKDYKNKKIKTSNVFCKYYEKKYTAITVSSINSIFDTLKEKFWSKCSLERICSTLIPMLYKSGYTIEEISYLTGKSLSILEKIIPYDEMIKGINLDKPHKERIHPFANILGL